MGRAYIRFALEEQTCYRLIFDFAEPKGATGARVRPRGSARPRRHHRPCPYDGGAGYYKGDPELIGHVFWASLHGVVVLHLAGKLDGEAISTRCWVK